MLQQQSCPETLQAVTLGDVNGDGKLEVVFGTTAGHIYALSGDTGRDITNFPFRTHGRIAASVLITQLTQGLSQQLVVMSFDGHLYMVDGLSGDESIDPDIASGCVSSTRLVHALTGGILCKQSVT